jgi:hypothetical protein
MSIDRLTRIIAAYGSSPERWPADERAAALSLRALIEDSGAPPLRARLAAALDEARSIDGVLAGFAAPVPDAAVSRLTAAVAFPPPRAQKPPRQSAFDLSGLFRAVLRPSAAVFATMAVLGLAVGFAVDPAYSSGDGSDYTVSQSADAGFDGLGSGDLMQ